MTDFTTDYTPHARLLVALDLLNVALVHMHAPAFSTARHIMLERRDALRVESNVERAREHVRKAVAAIYGGPREAIDADGETLDREQRAVLDAALELRAP